MYMLPDSLRLTPKKRHSPAFRCSVSTVVQGVNTCRTLTRQLLSWEERLGEHDEARGAAEALRARLREIELELVQPEFTSEGDTLNYRQMLFEKLYTLVPVVASADARPTAQSYDVFDKLAGQADAQLDALAGVVTDDVAAFNQRLDELDLPRIGA